MVVNKPSVAMIKRYDEIIKEIKLIEEYFDHMINISDKQFLMERYTYLLLQKQETAASFKEMKKWGSYKCVA